MRVVNSELNSKALTEPVLVGRENELRELQSLLNSAVEGRGSTVFVSGEAGSGKTRLVNEFLGMVKEKEIAVLSGWCLSDIAVPYFPFVEAFKKYFSAKNSVNAEQAEDEEAEIKAWLAGPKIAEKTGFSLTPQAWKDLAVAAVTNALLSMSTKKTIVLFIDDLHWADSASLSLLHYISRSIASSRILVLATYRTEELNPSVEGHPHPLVETIRLMRREDLLKGINLSNLSQANVSALAEKMVGGSLHSELAERLAEESRGNPLFVVESLRMLSEHGSLVQERGQWRLSIDEVGIPAKIKDIILRRVSMLKPNQRRVLDLASVIGNKFDVELLAMVMGEDSLGVLEVLNAVAQSSSLVCSGGSFYEFDHVKSRDAIYGEISPPLRRGYHARIAEKMEAKSKDTKNLPVSELAYHYSQASNREKAVEYSLAAGEDALLRFSNAEAIRYYTYVLDAVSEASEYSGKRMVALEGLGDALSADGFFEEATESFEQLSNITEPSVIKLRALRKALVCTYWVGNRAHSLELGDKAEEYAKFDRLEYARLRLYRGFVARIMGRTKEAFEDMEGALKVFEEEYSLIDVAGALAELVLFYYGEDRLEDEFAAALRSITLYEELEDLRGQLLALNRLGFALNSPVLYQEALDNAEKGVKIGEKVGDYNMTALTLWGLATVQASRGDYRAAIAQSLKAADYAEKTDSYYTQNICYSSLVKYYVMLGEVEHAEEFAKKVDKLFNEIAILKNNLESVMMARGSKAFLLSAKGRWKEANEIFEEFSENKDRSPWGSGTQVGLRQDYAWVLAKQGRTEEAKVQLEEAQKITEKFGEKLEKLEHANVQAYLMARREIGVGEELNIRLDIVNVAKKHATIVRVEGLIPPELKVKTQSTYCNLQNGSIDMKERKLGPFKIETIRLTLQAAKAGVFTLNPQVVYIDDLGETKTCKPNPINITVQPAKPKYEVLPGRVSTGSEELDALLFGGTPEKSAVMLTAPSTDEREQLVRRFLETGAAVGEIAFHISAETVGAKQLLEKHPANFCLFLCNPQADSMIQSAPNVFKLKGVENLTNMDIALTKAYRALDPSLVSSRRICIEIVSDVLLQHHAITTRRWLTALLPTLKSKGFTILAVIDPGMHPAEEVQAVLGLFDGEINIYEKETPEGTAQFLRIKKMAGQKYLKDEIRLKEE